MKIHLFGSLQLPANRRAVALAVTAALSLFAGIAANAQASATVMPEPAQSDTFVTHLPGVYSAREEPLVEKYLAQNRALQERGPIDVHKLITGTLPADTPGLGPVIHVTADWVRYNNAKYDADNPLRMDAAYARQAGYRDIPAYPTFGAHDDTFMKPYPPGARDKLLVSDLNHNVTSYRPIYAGDTLYLVDNERTVLDLTPPQGSIRRDIVIQTKGSVYNQRGEKVNDVIFRVTESLEEYKDPARIPKSPTFQDMWVAPDWLSRPAHVYTDADWQTIRGIWAKETRRGAEPLYWEDVQVGDQPAWTLDGPIEASVSPVAPWGMGVGGSRTLKREITDPKIFATMIRNEKDGIYRLPNRDDYVPRVPSGPSSGGGVLPAQKAEAGAIVTTDIHKDGIKRSPLVNYMGRDLAIRQITNWMGDKGWLENIRWSIMDPRVDADFGIYVPKDPLAEHYLDRVPFMKGRYVNTHGLTGDVAIVKSYVTDKEVRDGRFVVNLVWWVETIDGKIWLEGGATVRLPSKRLGQTSAVPQDGA